MKQPLIYQIEDLQSARSFLNNYHDKVILTNPPGSGQYYGMLVLDYMFKALQQEFPQIIAIQVRCDDNLAARETALRLGYQIID